MHGHRQFVPRGVLLSQATNETHAANCYRWRYDAPGTLAGLPLLKRMKEWATVGQYAPNPPGPHAGRKGRYNGLLRRKATLISKAGLSWDCGLQLALMNLESLVVACHHRAANVSLFLAHTARRFMRVVSGRGGFRGGSSILGAASRKKS